MNITNTNDNVREDVRITGLVTAAVVKPEVFFGIDAADARQVVTQIVAGESPKPAQGMTSDTLLKRVAEWLNEVTSQWSQLLVIGHRATHFALDHLILGIPLAQAVCGDFVWQPGWTYDIPD